MTNSGKLCAVVPTLVCAYAVIFGPLYEFFYPLSLDGGGNLEAGIPNRIFWPTMAVLTAIIVARNLSRFDRHLFPSNIVWLALLLCLAGFSVSWAFDPKASFTRFSQQAMVLASITLPGLLATRADLVRGLFLCFGVGALLNLVFLMDNSATMVAKVGGYSGYFRGKNYLGEFSGIALLLALYELLRPGARRMAGVFVLIIAVVLLFLSNSKTAFGLALLAPALAAVTLLMSRFLRLSPSIILVCILLAYIALSTLFGVTSSRLGYAIYGDPTFTGRTVIWGYVSAEIDHRPLLGWGYQSFWLVGPYGPSVMNAPAWVKMMPNAHNGYYDILLEVGYVGLALLFAFIFTTIHAVGKVADRDALRAHQLLSIVLYVIFYNFLESLWMRSFEFAWVTFVIAAVDAGRYARAARAQNSAQGRVRHAVPS
jgi:exopolysaccharide production protein ExoQ